MSEEHQMSDNVTGELLAEVRRLELALSTTEQSLASFKSRAERAEAVVEALMKMLQAKKGVWLNAATSYEDGWDDACNEIKRDALSLLHQPTENRQETKDE